MPPRNGLPPAPWISQSAHKLLCVSEWSCPRSEGCNRMQGDHHGHQLTTQPYVSSCVATSSSSLLLLLLQPLEHVVLVVLVCLCKGFPSSGALYSSCASQGLLGCT